VYAGSCASLAVAVAVIVALHLASGRGGLYSSWALTALLGVCAAGLGSILLWRRPEQPLGWVIAALGGLTLLQTFVDTYAAYATHVAPLPGAAWVYTVDELPSGLLIALLTLVLLLFPTGRLAGHGWRWVLAALAVVTVAGLPGRLTAPGRFDGMPALVNPLGVHAPALKTLTAVANVAGIPLLLAAAASVLLRWRRADPLTREQIKGLLAAVALWPVIIVVLLATPTSFSDSRWGEALFALPVNAMLVAVAVAVLRYRLYEIDRFISRTLSYAVVTGVLAGGYVGCVALLTRPLPFSSSIGVAASTLLVAAAFNPVRRRVQVAVDRRFNRSRYDAARVAAAYSGRLRQAVDVDTVTADLVAAVVAAVEPSTVAWWSPSNG
jgi:hypothetical protein